MKDTKKFIMSRNLTKTTPFIVQWFLEHPKDERLPQTSPLKTRQSIVFLILTILLLIPFFVPFVKASVELKTIEKSPIIIAEIGNPAIYEIQITSEEDDVFEIYSLIGVTFVPRGTFDVLANTTTKFEVKVYPPQETRKRIGTYRFEYELNSQKSGVIKDKLTIKVVSLKESLSFSIDKIKIEDNSTTIYIKNNQNTFIDNLKIKFKSIFFDVEKTVALNPFETINVTISLDNSKMASLLAGSYVFNADVLLADSNIEFSGAFQYLESEKITTSKKTEGYIVRKTTTTKTNEGNIPIITQITFKQDIISRLFTLNSLEPSSVIRKGFFVTYTWEKSLDPQNYFKVISTTNYTLPFIFIILIVVIAIFVGVYKRTSIFLVKRVSYVKTRAGEFALKIRVRIKARHNVDNIQLIDKLPGMTKLYEKFGTRPDKIDSLNHRVFWNIPYLRAGEERVYSYIIYSKLKIFGRFELPPASANFTYLGKQKTVWSNRTFFVAETTKAEF